MSLSEPLFVVLPKDHIIARLVKAGAHALSAIGYFGNSVAYYSRNSDVIVIVLGNHVILLRAPINEANKDTIMSSVRAVVQAEVNKAEERIMEQIGELIGRINVRLENLEQQAFAQANELDEDRGEPIITDEEEDEETTF